MDAANLAGRELGEPAIAPGRARPATCRWTPSGSPPTRSVTRRSINFNVPAFVFAGETLHRHRGRLQRLLGGRRGRASADIQCCAAPGPARTRPARTTSWPRSGPTWTAPARRASSRPTLTDGVDSWIVVEWRVNLFGTTSQRVFQHWLGRQRRPRTSRFAYDPANLPAAPPAGYGLTVGAENSAGTAGDDLAPGADDPAPTEDLRVTSTPGAPGGTLSYSFELKGVRAGTGEVRTTLRSPLVRGTTTDFDQITVEAT